MLPQADAKSLLSAAAVRDRAHRMLAHGDRLPNFRVNLGRLSEAARLVIDTTRAAYPALDIPFHSRWRHFEVDGIDRWREIAGKAKWPRPAHGSVDLHRPNPVMPGLAPGIHAFASTKEGVDGRDKPGHDEREALPEREALQAGDAARGRAAFDLAIVSVLLDAGAGTAWRFHDAVSGRDIGRSEGLALASLEMFRTGAFSARPDEPLRADASALAALSDEALARGFQVSRNNPLQGIDGRCALLRRLGQVALAAPGVFGREDTPRPGGFFDHLASLAVNRRIAAPAILSELLIHFGPIWPSRLTLDGVALGDCWRHPSLIVGDRTDGLVPFHKLSQWLAYSLIEPLQQAGIEVADIDGLTGLAEYRNGGLFIDTGVLELRDPAAACRQHTVDSELVVEWRALTVALLDRLADLVRAELGKNRESLPLARVLQGGTWTAGRIAAARLRADGSPPLKIVSDGTVF